MKTRVAPPGRAGPPSRPPETRGADGRVNGKDVPDVEANPFASGQDGSCPPSRVSWAACRNTNASGGTSAHRHTKPFGTRQTPNLLPRSRELARLAKGPTLEHVFSLSHALVGAASKPSSPERPIVARRGRGPDVGLPLSGFARDERRAGSRIRSWACSCFPRDRRPCVVARRGHATRRSLGPRAFAAGISHLVLDALVGVTREPWLWPPTNESWRLPFGSCRAQTTRR